MDKSFSEQAKTARERDEKQVVGETGAVGDTPKKLPKGVVLGKDGKP